VEDPIEFLYTDNRSLVSQKEPGSDVTSFEKALKFASVEKDIELLKRGINMSSATDMYNDMFE